MAEFYKRKKRVCYSCTTGKEIDYKDVESLKKYINDRVKFYLDELLACSKHQRHIAGQIKRARTIALLPYSD